MRLRGDDNGVHEGSVAHDTVQTRGRVAPALALTRIS
jgi:hypothetical protein